MTAEAPARTGPHVGTIAWVVGIVLVTYLLAPGPLRYLVILSGGNPRLMKVLQTIYTPLEYVYLNVGFVRDFYDWYFSLFA